MARRLSQLNTNLKELEAERVQLLRDHTDMALSQFSKVLPSSDRHPRNPFATPKDTTGHDRHSTPWAPRYGNSRHQPVDHYHRDASPPQLREPSRYYRSGSPLRSGAADASYHRYTVPAAPQPRHAPFDPHYRRSASPLRHGLGDAGYQRRLSPPRYGTGRGYHRDYSPPRVAHDLNPAMIAMLPKPELMKFDGDPTKYMEFSSQFR